VEARGEHQVGGGASPRAGWCDQVHDRGYEWVWGIRLIDGVADFGVDGGGPGDGGGVTRGGGDALLRRS